MSKLLPPSTTVEDLTAEQLLERKTLQVADAERELIAKAVALEAATDRLRAAQALWRTEHADLIDAAEQAKAEYTVVEMELGALAAETVPTPDQSPETGTFRSVIRSAFTLLQFKAKTIEKLTATGPVVVDWAQKNLPALVVQTVDEKALLKVVSAMPPANRPPFFESKETLEVQFRRKDIEARVALEANREAATNAAPF